MKKELDESKSNQILIESEWLKCICAGDSNAFESLFYFYSQRLIYFSRSFVSDKQIAEDIIQDLFVKIWQNRKNLDTSKSIKSYLYSAVKNESLKFLRDTKFEIKDDEKILTMHGNFNEPDKELECKELNEKIYSAINSLPEKCREIFIMNRFDHLKYREIAELLDISIKTVETQMGRALKKLKEILGSLLSVILLFLKYY